MELANNAAKHTNGGTTYNKNMKLIAPLYLDGPFSMFPDRPYIPAIACYPIELLVIRHSPPHTALHM